MILKSSAAVCTGQLHKNDGIPCQDKIFKESYGMVTCVALADGAGSRTYSHVGAECVTKLVSQMVCKEFDDYWQMESNQLAKKLIEHCIQELQKKEYPLYELASTLLFCAAHEDGRYLLGHLGDGVIVLVQDQRLTTISQPEQGEYCNETCFVVQPDAVEHLRFLRGKRQSKDVILMMSDGAAESLYQYHDSVPAPACLTLANWVREREENAVTRGLQKALEQTLSKHTNDDMSVAMIVWIDKK